MLAHACCSSVVLHGEHACSLVCIVVGVVLGLSLSLSLSAVLDSAVLAKLSCIEAEQKALKEQGQATLKSQEELKRRFDATAAPSFSMSDAGSDKNWLLIAKAGFELQATPWTEDFTTGLLGADPRPSFQATQPKAFRWDDDVRISEKAHQDRYLPYLQEVLLMPRDLQLAAAPNNLLDTDDRLGFKLTGTSDVVVLDREIDRAIGHEAAIRALFELKKKVNERAVKQGAAELIAAAVKAQYSPFVVLTDLVDDWRFLWLKERRTITVMCTPLPTAADPFIARRCAFLLLRRLFATASSLDADRLAAISLLDAAPAAAAIGKRQKLSPIKERPKPDAEAGEAAQRVGSPSECSDSDDVDGPGWDEEDRQALLYRQVRSWVRNTPWLQDVCRPRIVVPPMSAAVRNSMYA